MAAVNTGKEFLVLFALVPVYFFLRLLERKERPKWHKNGEKPLDAKISYRLHKNRGIYLDVKITLETLNSRKPGIVIPVK